MNNCNLRRVLMAMRLNYLLINSCKECIFDSEKIDFLATEIIIILK